VNSCGKWNSVCGVVYLRTKVNHSTISVFEVIGSQMSSPQQLAQFAVELSKKLDTIAMEKLSSEFAEISTSGTVAGGQR
jgi:hypothetical protein